MVNNYFITGPSTTSNSDAAFYQVDSGDQMYATGNLEDTNKNGVLDGSSVSPGGATVESSPWFASTSTMPTSTAAGAYAYDTAYAGQSLSRDSLDSLDIGQVESLGTSGGTASTGDHLYTSPSQSGLANGGYGTITGGTPPTSSANDGIADTWATTHGVATWAAAHGTTTANPAFAMVLDQLGYSEVEDYANSLADQFVSQTWSAASGDWTTPANWNSTAPGNFQHALIRGTGTADGSVTITTSGNLAESLSIGGNGLSAGEQVSVSSGGLTIEDTIVVGDQNNGTLAISGGSVIASNVQLGDTVWDSSGNATNYVGTLNLSGGTLQTGQLVQGAGTPGSWTSGANWTWSGGTVEAQTTGLFVNAPATLGSGGAILNTNGATATLTGVLSGSGSFTKNGAGLAVLSAANTYTGGTIINTGAVEAANNQALGTQTVTINIGDGLQLANGVSLANTILANGGASEVVDVPFANASATLAGNISLESQGVDQYRVGVSGTNATLMLTGATTVNSAISLITHGNIVFAHTGSLSVANNGVEIGRSSATSSVNLTVQDNASISATSISLGGLNGSSDDLNTNVTLLGNGALNANTGSLNIDNSLTTNNTTTLTLSGSSNVYAGNIVETSTATGHVATVNLNGGTINATANDPSGGSFLPALNAATFNVKTGGAIVNNGGFSIALAQPLLGTANDGGFTSEGGGTTTLMGVDTYNGPTKVTSGTLVIGVNGALPNTNVAITGGTLQLGTGTGLAQMTSLSIAGNGVLDVNNNHVIITYGSSDPFSTIAGYVKSGYNGGGWNGLGIISTAARTPTNGLLYGVGYADGADGVVSGLASGQIEVKYTLLGDANLDGLVNAADFTILAANFNQPVTGWDQGDFNYDGLVNAADFTDLAANFNQSVSGAASAGDVAALDAFAAANGLVADVPEPMSSGLLISVASGVLFCRRRRQSSLNTPPLMTFKIFVVFPKRSH